MRGVVAAWQGAGKYANGLARTCDQASVGRGTVAAALTSS